jgi:flagellin
MSLLNSINTNIGATIALEALDSTTSQLQATQKQISTGYRVNDAKDDGAAYAVAQRVRSDVGALTTANQQLGDATGLVTTTITGLNQVSNTVNAARATLVTLADGDTTGTQRTQYIAQYNSDIANIKSDLQDDSYNGKTLTAKRWWATSRVRRAPSPRSTWCATSLVRPTTSPLSADRRCSGR